MERKKIDRINELARLSRERALTESEKEEQRELRSEYLNAIRSDFKRTLDSIEFKD